MTPLQQTFAQLEARLTPEIAARIGCPVLLRIGTDAADHRTLRLDRAEGPFLSSEPAEAPRCTLVIANLEYWFELTTGRTTPTAALMSGKMRVEGDLSVAMKLERWVLSPPLGG